MEVAPKYQNIKERCSNISAAADETSFIHQNPTMWLPQLYQCTDCLHFSTQS